MPEFEFISVFVSIVPAFAMVEWSDEKLLPIGIRNTHKRPI